MQTRMKKHQLSAEEIDSLLKETKVGHLGTLNADGAPYVVPVHFIKIGEAIYIHGLSQGQKLDNIRKDSRVCFELEKMNGLILDEKACDVNTDYQSIVILGKAELLETSDEKAAVLEKFVQKYTPHLAGQVFPENMLKGTGVIKIITLSCTGKFYK